MVEVTLDGDKVISNVKGSHKLWALKSRLDIPRSNIRGARRDPSVVRGWKGWRLPGTDVPGLITAGTFYVDGKRIFGDVSNPENAVVIELKDETYSQLVVEARDPDEVVRLLSTAT